MAVNQVILNNDTVIDLTNDTVTVDNLSVGETAHNRNGDIITGTMQKTTSGSFTASSSSTKQEINTSLNEVSSFVLVKTNFSNKNDGCRSVTIIDGLITGYYYYTSWISSHYDTVSNVSINGGIITIKGDSDEGCEGDYSWVATGT